MKAVCWHSRTISSMDVIDEWDTEVGTGEEGGREGRRWLKRRLVGEVEVKEGRGV